MPQAPSLLAGVLNLTTDNPIDLISCFYVLDKLLL
tara:strand:- start:96989 stop:97093 length:105 start_codon:yes stop_codon:yes gene_type:complete